MSRSIARAAVASIAVLVLSGTAVAEGEAPGVQSAAPTTPEGTASADRQAAGAQVDQLHAALLDVMQNAESLGYEGRHDRLAPVLVETFDLPFMAEKSVGRHWRSASEAEQAELVETFTRFMFANYAGRFDGYSGQHFETLRVEPSARGTLLVRTRLVDPEGDDVDLDYRLRRAAGGGWKIIDVYLKGTVSELALRRSEYSSLIKREGFQALLAALNARIETLATPANSAG